MDDATRARQLYEIVTMRRELEKKEKLLKDYFREQLLITDSVTVGDFVVTITERERTDIKRDELKLLLGESFKNYEVKTKYQIIDVKKNKY